MYATYWGGNQWYQKNGRTADGIREIAHIDGQINLISTFSYTYESNGMIKTWTQQEGTASPHTFTFGYDHANRLRSAVKEDNTQTPVAEWDYRYVLPLKFPSYF